LLPYFGSPELFKDAMMENFDRCAAAVKALAESIKVNPRFYARSGRNTLNQSEEKDHQLRIDGLVTELEELATAGPQGAVSYRQVEAIMSKLRAEGLRLDDSLVSDIAKAFVGRDG
jgi:hypothetical protein